MRYRLRLTIRYEFALPTGAGRQLLRISPAHLPLVQTVEDLGIEILPAPVETSRFRDFFDTEVVQISLPAGLTGLTFDMTAEVTRHDRHDTGDQTPPPVDLAAELATVRDLGPHSPHHFLPPSPLIPEVTAIAEFAARTTMGATSLRDLIEMLGQALHAQMRFDADATEVDTPITTAFAGRHGVCQDFSQIMISGLRSLGVPASYVSGFLRTLAPPGRPRLIGADAMHAWVRAWAGNQTGWVEYDPTNACFVALDHVVIGYGRDYSDAAPVTGSMRLSGSQSGSHSVDIAEID